MHRYGVSNGIPLRLVSPELAQGLTTFFISLSRISTLKDRKTHASLNKFKLPLQFLTPTFLHSDILDLKTKLIVRVERSLVQYDR